MELIRTASQETLREIDKISPGHSPEMVLQEVPTIVAVSKRNADVEPLPKLFREPGMGMYPYLTL